MVRMKKLPVWPISTIFAYINKKKNIMKKKTTMFIALASVMLGVGYGAISQKNDSKNTDSILLENVEALASKE